MALDPKTLKELNNAIKVLSGTGKEISSKARELMTFIYAAQEGFLGVGDNLKQALDGVSSGKFELPNLRKYLSSLKLADDVIEDILEKRKELEELDDDRIRSTKSYYKMLDLIYGLEEDRFNLSSKTVSAFDELNVQLIDQQRLIKSIGLSTGTNTDALSKQIQKHQELNKIFVNDYLSTEDIQGHLQNIGDIIDNISAKSHNIGGVKLSTDDAIKKLAGISNAQIDMLNIEDQARRKKLEAFVAYASGKKLDIATGELFDAKGVAIVGDNLSKLSTHIRSMADQYDALVEKVRIQGGMTTDISMEIDTMVDRMAKKQKLTGKVVDDLKNLTREVIIQNELQKTHNDASLKSLQHVTENLSILRQYAPALNKAQNAASGLADKVEGLLDVIPAGIQKFLGLDKIGEGIRTSGVNAVKAFNDKLLETGSSSKAISAGIKSWGGGIRASIGLTGAFALVLAGAYKFTKMLDDANREVAERMGLSLLQARKLNRANLDLISSHENQFLVMEDIRGVQEAYIKSTGQVFDMTSAHGQHMVKDLGEMSRAFGYSAERAVEMQEMFSQLGASEEFSKSLQRDVGFMSQLAGLSPEIITSDMVENADILATYFAGMPAEAAKTAIAVRRMGMNLKQAGNLAKSMLDLEGFMTDMFELAAMNGPNLSKAFDLGISGDLEGMTKEVMNAIGSVEAFGQMDFLQREKLAKTLGMSTDEIAKALLLKEKSIGLDKDQATLLADRMDDIHNLKDMDQAAIQAQLLQFESTNKLANAWGRIKAILIKSILPIAESFAKTLEDGSPIIDGLVDLTKLLGVALKGVAWFVSGMMIPLRIIGKLVGLIYHGVEGIAKFFGKAEHGAHETKTEVAGIETVLKGLITAVGAYVGLMMLLPKGVTSWIGKVIPGLGKVSGLFGNIGSRIGKMLTLGGKEGILGKIFGKAPTVEFDKISKRFRDINTGKFVKTPKAGKGLIGKLLGGGQQVETPTASPMEGQLPDASKRVGNWGDGLMKKIQSIGKVIRTGMWEIYNVVKSGAKIIIDAFKTVLQGLGEIAVKLVELVMKPMEALARGLGKVFVSLLSSIGKGLSSFGVKSLIGAASMVVLAGALYITAKAVKEFVSVEWGDMAKAGAALTGLTAIAAILGSLAGQLIVGSVALAIMGAALIPAAFALGMFADVSWDDLAKAGVAIVGLSAAIGILGGIMMSGFGAAVILAGAAALAVMGASLLPLAVAVKKLSESNMPSVSEGLKNIGKSVATMNTVKLKSGDSSPLSMLRELAEVADPLMIAARAINQIGESITELSDRLEKADFSKLSEFQKFKGLFGTMGVKMPMRGEATTGVAQPPSKESTAQNVLIKDSGARDTGGASMSVDEQIQQRVSDSQSSGNMRRMEQLLVQMITELQGINKRPIVLDFGDGTMKTLNAKIKGLNNNR